jgi:predicted protein tyrosine phosphatase
MISEIRENVLIGEFGDVVSQFKETSVQNKKLLKNLEKLKITDVLSLCNSNEENCLNRKEIMSFEKNRQIRIRLHHQPVPSKNGSYEEGFKLALKELCKILSDDPKAKVLVHCFGGVDRSPFLVASFLSLCYKMSLQDAYSEIRKVRPFIARHYEWKWWDQ